MILLLYFLHFSVSPNNGTLLLISLDGFRWDYLDLCKEFNFSTPNFDKLKKMGVSLKNSGTKNVFPTQTLPNHFSIVTGDYAETHQIIANSFYDSNVNNSYPNDYAWDYWYKYAKTIWVVNQEQGGKSGCYGWPGADVDSSISCTYNSHNYYDGLYGDSLSQAVDHVFKWILDTEDPVNLGILYYTEPDESGHKYGIDKRTLKEIADLDYGIGKLLEYIEKSHAMGIDLNIILTADHGMVDTPNDPGLIFTIDRIVSHDDYTCYECSLSPFALIYPKEGKENIVYEKLKNHNENLHVYWRKDVPEDFHYSNSERIPPIVLEAVFPYMITDTLLLPNRAGQHGYNRNLPQMHPIFIAAGSKFKENFVAEPFESVDIFPLMCHILNIDSPPVNGSFSRIKHILKSDSNNTKIKTLTKHFFKILVDLFN